MQSFLCFIFSYLLLSSYLLIFSLFFWGGGKIISLIIASKYRPLPLLMETLPLLNSGAPFVVYCEYMEPLTECYVHLQQQSGETVGLSLTDTWLREYQTLPGRTHPMMFMPTSGGYLLSGTYVGGTMRPQVSLDVGLASSGIHAMDDEIITSEAQQPHENEQTKC